MWQRRACRGDISPLYVPAFLALIFLVLAHCAGSSKPGWQRLGQKSRRPLYLQLRSMVPQIRTSAFGVRRAKAALSSGCKPHPANSLPPEATGAVMEVTKWLKPSDSVSRIGGSASVQAATRVNAEQTSKMKMCGPTWPSYQGRLTRLGERAKKTPKPTHRGSGGSMYTRKAHATREAPWRGRGRPTGRP